MDKEKKSQHVGACIHTYVFLFSDGSVVVRLQILFDKYIHL